MELVSPARGVGDQLVREHMLAHFLLAELAFYPSCARHTRFLPALPYSHVLVKGIWGLCRTRMAEQKNLPALHALLRRAIPDCYDGETW